MGSHEQPGGKDEANRAIVEGMEVYFNDIDSSMRPRKLLASAEARATEAKASLNARFAELGVRVGETAIHYVDQGTSELFVVFHLCRRS